MVQAQEPQKTTMSKAERRRQAKAIAKENHIKRDYAYRVIDGIWTPEEAKTYQTQEKGQQRERQEWRQQRREKAQALSQKERIDISFAFPVIDCHITLERAKELQAQQEAKKEARCQEIQERTTCRTARRQAITEIAAREQISHQLAALVLDRELTPQQARNRHSILDPVRGRKMPPSFWTGSVRNREALQNGHLLTRSETAQRLGVSPTWVSKHLCYSEWHHTYPRKYGNGSVAYYYDPDHLREQLETLTSTGNKKAKQIYPRLHKEAILRQMQADLDKWNRLVKARNRQLADYAAGKVERLPGKVPNLAYNEWKKVIDKMANHSTYSMSGTPKQRRKFRERIRKVLNALGPPKFLRLALPAPENKHLQETKRQNGPKSDPIQEPT